VILFYRILQFLRIYRSVGVLSIVLDNILVDVSKFLVILFVFVLGNSFAFSILFPNPNNYKQGHLLGGHPIWEPWWGIVGSFSYLNLVAHLNDQEPQMMTTMTVAPAMLWFYQFMVTMCVVCSFKPVTHTLGPGRMWPALEQIVASMLQQQWLRASSPPRATLLAFAASSSTC
jgi:hypothetical protein